MALASAGIQITFSPDTCGVGECGGRAFEVTPAGTLEPSDEVVFNVYGATLGLISNLEMWWGGRSLGDGVITSAVAAVTETLSFRGTDKEQLKYPGNNITCLAITDVMQVDKDTEALSLFIPAGSVVPLERIGFSCIGTTANINLYGTIKVSYTIVGSKISWNWTVPVAGGDHYFYLIQDNALVYNHMITIDTDDYDTLSPMDVVVVVREYTTETLVAGAAIEINGVYAGVTDEDGRINIGSKPVGRYTIKITKSGYVDSDLDDLENDSFIVGST